MLRSFLHIPIDSHFSLQNLPYGIFSTADRGARPGVAIGDYVLDLKAAHAAQLLSGPILSQSSCFQQATLNGLMELGKPAWQEARITLTRLLSGEEGALRDSSALQEKCLLRQEDVCMHLPAAIGDYTDFYCSHEHATNCGIMFRGKDNALNPNWGQVQGGEAGQPPRFGTSQAVDFELELGCFIGVGNELGTPISMEQAADHIFGYVLVNDWSARDIQRWEYVPLGPFNSKNWATSISPWVVTAEALEPFRALAPPQDPAPLPYLAGERWNYDLQLEVDITPQGEQPSTVTRSDLSTLYWTLPQMIAHHTAGGCNLRPGDLLATGTLSKEGPGGQGCLLELTWAGSRPLKLASASEAKKAAGQDQQRTYLEDGDEVVVRGWCQGGGFRVGFGECRGRLLPAV
ncbi:hypothetical protein N2152v2_003898 [Parachlorella kessleri]